jgi:protein-S-isoprenylcysteine O-methyltransferase Ste14
VPESRPRIFVPPPFLFAVGFLLGLAVHRWVWPIHLPESVRPAAVPAGWLLIAGGLALTFWAMLTFVRAKTTVLPFKSARTIVSAGPFRFSRNPMYIGLTVAYAGLTLLFGLVWPFVALPFVLRSLHALVIRREEEYLTSAFGTEYTAYRERVRRWL